MQKDRLNVTKVQYYASMLFFKESPIFTKKIALDLYLYAAANKEAN